jgi:uncharacterized DUF497 family protein
VEFEFDPAKSEVNRKTRGFGFAFAAEVFVGRTVESPARSLAGEHRTKAIGRIGDLCYAVIYTDGGMVRRIISARRANRKETREWHASA